MTLRTVGSSTAQFLLRQSGFLGVLALAAAFVQSVRVVTALCHGVDLHGDWFEGMPGKLVVMSVWDVTLQAMGFAGAGTILILVAARCRAAGRRHERSHDRRTHR